MKNKDYPILYSFRRCPYAIRARLALYYSETDCILQEVSLKDKPAHMLKISPKGTVPVLQLPDGRVIDESLDIVQYSLLQSDPSGLLDITEVQQLQADELRRRLHQEFIPLLTRYKYYTRYPEYSQQQYLAQLEEGYLQLIESKLTTQQYLVADTIKAIDVIVLPFIRQFYLVDIEWLANSKYQAIYRWLTSVLDADWFEKLVMQKHNPWQEGDDIVLYL